MRGPSARVFVIVALALATTAMTWTSADALGDVNWRRQYTRARTREATAFHGLLVCRVRAERGRSYDGAGVLPGRVPVFPGVSVRFARPRLHAPELMTRIAVGARVVEMGGAQDRYEEYVALGGLRLTVGTELSVSVRDQDIASDDMLGRMTLRYEGRFPMTAEASPASISCRGQEQRPLLRSQRGALRRLGRALARLPEPELDDTDPEFDGTFLSRLKTVTRSLAPLRQLLGDDAEELSDAITTTTTREQRFRASVRERLASGGSAFEMTRHEYIDTMTTPADRSFESHREAHEEQIRLRERFRYRRAVPLRVFRVNVKNAERRRAPRARLYKDSEAIEGRTEVFLLGGRRPRRLRPNARLPRGDAELMVAYYGSEALPDVLRLVYRQGAVYLRLRGATAP